MSQYTISRLTTCEERKEFLHFWSHFQGNDQSDVFAWLNARAGSEAVVFLLIEIESSRCVGCLMVIPRRLYIEGTPFDIGIAGIFIVDEGHRTLLPALRLTKEAKALVANGEFDLIYGLPNDKATAVFKRAGFSKLGPFVRLTKALSVSKRLHPGKIRHQLLKPFAYLFDKLNLLTQPETWHRTPSGLRCEVMRDLDARIDQLWETVRKQHSIIGDRSREYLQWRFNMYTGADISIFVMLNEEKDKALGYIAYRTKNGYISIRDIILPSESDATRSLILNFVRYARRLHSKSVTVDLMENNTLSRIFEMYGFSLSHSNRNVQFTCTEQFAADHPLIYDSSNWLLFRGDMDP